MKIETISQRENILIRRHILGPGEALPWHTDLCHRFSVIIQGDSLSIEFRDSDKIETFAVYPGLTGWDQPEPKVHRGLNSGKTTYEEVVIFFLSAPDMEPQPRA